MPGIAWPAVVRAPLAALSISSITTIGLPTPVVSMRETRSPDLAVVHPDSTPDSAKSPRVVAEITIDGSPSAAASPVAQVVFPVPGGPTRSIGGRLVPSPAVARAPCIAATEAPRIQGARS